MVSEFEDFILKPDPKLAKPNEARIYIDTREGGSIPYFIRELMVKFKRQNIYIEQLAVGDFHVQSNDGSFQVVIERKGAGDFVASMTDGRLESQLPELANYDDSILLIHDSIYDKDLWIGTNMKVPDSVTRLQTSLAFRRNIVGGRPVIVKVPNISQVPVAIDYVANTIEQGRLIRTESPIRRKSKRFQDLRDPIVLRNVRLNQLASAPKVGWKKAEAVFNHFKWNYKKIQNARVEEFMVIDGIGKTMATRIYETYNAEVSYTG